MSKSSKNKVNPEVDQVAPIAEMSSPIRASKKTEMSLRVQYTDKELLEIGKKLAEANREHSQAEDEKKSITGTLKAKCDSIAARIQMHSGELTNGYTYRIIPCEVRYDAPKQGLKQTVRIDTGEVITTEAMSLHELQADLPLSESESESTMTNDGKIVSADGNTVRTEEDGDDFIDDKNNL